MDKTPLIYRVLSDLATQSEREELEQWLGYSSANREEFEDTKLLWQWVRAIRNSSGDEPSYDGLQRIKRTMRKLLQ